MDQVTTQEMTGSLDKKARRRFEILFLLLKLTYFGKWLHFNLSFLCSVLTILQTHCAKINTSTNSENNRIEEVDRVFAKEL